MLRRDIQTVAGSMLFAFSTSAARWLSLPCPSVVLATMPVRSMSPCANNGRKIFDPSTVILTKRFASVNEKFRKNSSK